MGTRRKAREIALQTLYQSEMVNVAPVASFETMCLHFEICKKSVPYALELVTGVTERLAAIDALVSAHAANWRLDRMAVIDRNIMRLATYEMMFRDDVPVSVAINEAIEIARKYSSDESCAFINGILDSMRVAMEKKEPAAS